MLREGGPGVRDLDERESAVPAGRPAEGRIRTSFIYYQPRDQLLADVAAGQAPDTALVGSNHLDELGIDARSQAPRAQLRIKYANLGILGRLPWNARELFAPWELGDTEVACSYWVKLFPLAARLRGGPAIVAFNVSLCTEFARSSPPRRRLARAALRSVAAVICFASAQRNRLLEQIELDPDRVHFVPWGVDERFFHPQPLPEDGHVLAVGVDVARDYRTLARAVVNLDAKVIIVGGEHALSGVDFPANTEVRTKVAYPELRRLYAAAACVVIPTYRDGYPFGADCSGHTTLLEAMAMGRPAVASKRATLSDYVRNGETALIVPPEDPRSLRSELERVLGDPRLASTVGAAGRRLVEDRYTTRHLAARLAPIIREAAAGRTTSANRR